MIIWLLQLRRRMMAWLLRRQMRRYDKLHERMCGYPNCDDIGWNGGFCQLHNPANWRAAKSMPLEENRTNEVFVATEDDGSRWIMFEDYQALQQKYLLSELALEEQIKINSALLQRL